MLSETKTADGLARIVFSTTRPVDALELEGLCTAVGWPKRPPAKVATALGHSYMVATLSLVTSQEGEPQASPTRRLVGMARATSDWAFNATVWDVLVSPALQGRGLGKALVELTSRRLLQRGISNVCLFSDINTVDFYKSLGFVSEPGAVKAMFFDAGPKRLF